MMPFFQNQYYMTAEDWEHRTLPPCPSEAYSIGRPSSDTAADSFVRSAYLQRALGNYVEEPDDKHRNDVHILPKILQMLQEMHDIATHRHEEVLKELSKEH